MNKYALHYSACFQKAADVFDDMDAKRTPEQWKQVMDHSHVVESHPAHQLFRQFQAPIAPPPLRLDRKTIDEGNGKMRTQLEVLGGLATAYGGLEAYKAYRRHQEKKQTQKAAAGDLDQNLRALSPEEITQVETKRRRLFPRSLGLDSPIDDNLSSPATGAVAGGLLGALGGAGLGAAAGHFTHRDPAGLAVTGAIAGGLGGGRLGYQTKEHGNERTIDKLREYPEGQATLRRVLTDHYLRSLERYGQTV